MKVVIKEENKILAEIPIDKSKSFADQIVEAYQQGAREFAEYLDNNGYYVSKTIWNDCGHVEDYLGVYDALAE